MRGAPTPTVSVIICAYTEERWDDLLAAVASAQRQTLPPIEVVLVVDHNSRLLERADEALRGVHCIANAGPQGLSGARNTGWRHSTGEIIAFLDDDAAAEPDWLENLVDPYGDPDVCGVGGSIAPEWIDGAPRALPEEFLWVVGCSYRGLPVERSEVRNMIGANMSLRRSALDLTSGFDSGLGRIGTRPVGCEETELCLRIIRSNANGRFVYEPRAHVRHNVPAARTTFGYFRSRCYAEGLSKAHVSRLAGTGAALRSESHYVRTTLPRGFAAAIGEGIRSRTAPPLYRAAAMVVGLTCTSAGYGVGRIRSRRAITTADSSPSDSSPSDSSTRLPLHA